MKKLRSKAAQAAKAARASGKSAAPVIKGAKVRAHQNGRVGGGAGGKSAGKGKAKPHDHTEKGKSICFAFIDRSRDCRGKWCKFAHVCGRCGVGKKPMYECGCTPHGGAYV